MNIRYITIYAIISFPFHETEAVMRIRMITCIWIVLSNVLLASSEGTITGWVTEKGTGNPLAGVTIRAEGTEFSAQSDTQGKFRLVLPSGTYTVIAVLTGYQNAKKADMVISAGDSLTVHFTLVPGTAVEEEISVTAIAQQADANRVMNAFVPGHALVMDGGGRAGKAFARQGMPAAPDWNTEEYARIYDNEFRDVLSNPLSTFSIDVDAGSYGIVRRYIMNNNQLPPKDAVRIEEMINYFHYDYPLPNDDKPFSVTMEYAPCPWEPSHRLVHIGLQGKILSEAERVPSNLVFLLDVSGSMNAPNKLPLLKKAFSLLVGELTPEDRISIVVYAGQAGLVLSPTSGDKKHEIRDALERLTAGGSTAGGEGIQLAYRTAKAHFLPKGNNRIILATDGDFNVGISSTSDMIRLVEEKRNEGIFLTALGFGMGNFKDHRLEQIADKGNGNYAYIDNLLEAKKVFQTDLMGTLYTIAKDVKIQVEFNPARVGFYRLIGYENRLLNREDFADDTKDAGEIGAGHTVTALYEIIPRTGDSARPGTGDLKYQQTTIKPDARSSGELLTLRIRYKKPDGDASREYETVLRENEYRPEKQSDNFRFSAAVARFGMLLRDSEFKGNSTIEKVISEARAAIGKDLFGYRAEFIRVAETAEIIMNTH